MQEERKFEEGDDDWEEPTDGEPEEEENDEQYDEE